MWGDHSVCVCIRNTNIYLPRQELHLSTEKPGISEGFLHPLKSALQRVLRCTENRYGAGTGKRPRVVFGSGCNGTMFARCFAAGNGEREGKTWFFASWTVVASDFTAKVFAPVRQRQRRFFSPKLQSNFKPES